MTSFLAKGPFCGFLVFYDGDPVAGRGHLVYATYREAINAVHRAERATHGNVSGTVHGVSMRPASCRAKTALQRETARKRRVALRKTPVSS